MPFLGKSPADGNNNVLMDAITTSATATYNLTKDSTAYTPISAQSLMVSLNGVTQAPIAAYTVSGSTIVFASALTSNDVIDYIIAFEGPIKNVGVSDISAGTLTTSMLADDAITVAKMAVNSVDSDQYVDGSIDLVHMSANSVDSDQYVDGSIDTAHIANDQITNALMADDAVGVAQLSATGTASSSTFLRGDNSWVAVGGAYNTWLVKTTTYTALVGDQIICNHASTAFTVTLPASPSAGNTVVLHNAGAALVTVGRNSSNINSTAADGELTTGNSTQLVYVDATIGWKEI